MRRLREIEAADPRLLRPRLDDPGHDPAVLADLTVTDELELLAGRQGAVVKESGGHRAGVLRVSLNGPAAQARDEIERTGELDLAAPKAGLSTQDVGSYQTCRQPLAETSMTGGDVGGPGEGYG